MALENVFGELANDKTITDLYNMMAYYMDRMEFGLNTDNAKRLKVNIDAGTLGTITTVGSVGSVGSVTNQQLIGGLTAQRQVEAVLDTAFNTGFLNNITF